MTEKQSGLRFDIYERVHLQEEDRSIRELDEIELVPFIEVVSQSDQAVLKGHLRLNGTYTAEEEGGTRQLEHRIPVEITLPLSRVGNSSDLSVEIENFDVDVLSPRSLNVTGVLSLHGVELAPQGQSGEWRAEEETVFVHRAEEGDAPSFSEPAVQWTAEPAIELTFRQPAEQVAEQSAEQPIEQPAEQATGQFAPSPEQEASAAPRAGEPPAVQSYPYAQPAQHLQPASQGAGASGANIVAAEESAKPLDVNVDVAAEETDVIGLEQVDEAELQPEIELHAEKKDVKVAFGSKKVAELAQEATYGIKSLLQKSSSVFIDKRKKTPAEAAAERPAEQPAAAETVEWKKLFLGSEAEGGQFRKLKLAIVQKEETLETIAQRYKLSPRELQLLNRLQDGEISEGQVIYIPR
ncbi:hypothetical protein SD70_14585 [Gordoniibacillus kamchatkensis]|uniref:LysM domain-containing protein n=1 Tax=Gordoniibacillus kamchatkensis TaxID=1590651 RepID=A0ABR5AH20_9BACL|nr:LysM peptidoglycan-binding domain-containing protein [Paenibacillus sp. VKM B-2647]KIL40307.1 hypothetical protein SD70_14585 [Paenibacillus sp. VKM B-2647]